MAIYKLHLYYNKKLVQTMLTCTGFLPLKEIGNGTILSLLLLSLLFLIAVVFF